MLKYEKLHAWHAFGIDWGAIQTEAYGPNLSTLSVSLFSLSLLSARTPDSTETAVYVDQSADRTSINQLVIESENTQIDIRIYTLDGQFVPATLWKSRSEKGFRFEAGYDLEQGVYLVRIENQGITRYQKLIVRTS